MSIGQDQAILRVHIRLTVRKGSSYIAKENKYDVYRETLIYNLCAWSAVLAISDCLKISLSLTMGTASSANHKWLEHQGI